MAQGELGHSITVRSQDELGVLADSFNTMTRELRDAHNELTDWARTLEARVEQKTQELKRAHDQMMRVEKMASIGKLAAVVAHEINNPLAGILTYAKLLKKWFAKGAIPDGTGRENDSRRYEVLSSLDLIESESRRCGEIVKNLLTFARATPLNFEPTNLKQIIDRCTLLVQHRLALGNIQLRLQVDQGLPQVRCDPAQIEQVLLALMMNAIDAMPAGGNLIVSLQFLAEKSRVQLQVKDDGAGISPELLPKLFEPFVTTKESGHGVGLGLAISQSIIERHQGRINVASEPGRGTVFTITLPVDAETSATASGARVVQHA